VFRLDFLGDTLEACFQRFLWKGCNVNPTHNHCTIGDYAFTQMSYFVGYSGVKGPDKPFLTRCFFYLICDPQLYYDGSGKETFSDPGIPI